MMNRVLAVASIVLVGLHRTPVINAWTKKETAHGKTIISYYASWQWYDREQLAKPSSMDHSKVTRYNFAFFQTDEKGNIWGTDSWADAIVLFGDNEWSAGEGDPTYCSWDTPKGPPNCAARKYDTGLLHLAHEAGVEVYPSIGGWTLSNNFPKMAADATARATFAANCVKLIEAYDFDGIDIE
jgi:chitinase